MAIFHLSVKPVSRKGGRSATAAAAYRAGELIYDETSGQTFDYTRKRGVAHAEIVLPTACARQDINWARDRQALWNAAEQAENRSNSRVAREYEIALPHELTPAQRVELARGFATEIADRHGVAVDFSIHAPHRSGDHRNWHVHLLATTRVIEPGGLGEKATIEWSDTNRRKAQLEPARKEIEAIRARWAERANETLHEHGHESRIDHRNLEAQGIARQPTVHLGPAVSGMERRGMATEVGKRLEFEGREAAQQRLERAAELGKLERERALVERSILDLSGDLEQAKRQRDLERSRAPAGKAPSLEEIRAQARADWLALRAEQKARELAQEKTPEVSREAAVSKPKPSPEELRRQGREQWLAMRTEQKALERTPGAGRSIQERQQQAAERWLEARRAQELEKGRAPSPAPERKSPEKDRGLELDGPELE
jgi:ATP-dependent exoDNAse (exonuclease V) alpha subunit